jgi:hydrogenase expression/formation protein HypC
MCLGIPMQVQSIEGGYAICSGLGETRTVDMSLLGQQPVGSWLLVFVDVARELLDAQRAEQIGRAIQALSNASQGLPFDDLFADLLDREPQLPEHLQTKTGK